MSISPGTFKHAMAQLASGVTVITMRADGEDYGFTATSFTSLSLDPMLVLVCIMQNQRSHDLLLKAGHYGVTFLEASQKELGLRFASPLAEQRFAGLSVVRAQTGAPLLPDAVAWLDCRVQDIFPGGDHSIVVGEVVAAAVSATAKAPLLYFDRRWGTFEAESVS